MTDLRMWDDAYRTGNYQNEWGVPYPSPDLVAFFAASQFKEGSKALDIGCGAGQESVFLAQQGLHVTGVDQSSEALKIAKQKAKQAGVKIQFYQGDVLNLPLADQAFDLINDRGCLHVITDNNREKYAQEMARVLKPGGKLFIRGCRKSNDSVSHFTAVNREAIEKYFSTHFTCQAILPIEIVKGNETDRLSANLVLLIRK